MLITFIVIDDDEFANSLYEAVLQAEFPGSIVKTTRDGADGVRLARLLRPDFIISDLMMPEPDGFKVCRILSKDKETRSIPIIIVTALNDTDSRERAIGPGASKYLTKPFRLDELLGSINDLLREKRLGLLDE